MITSTACRQFTLAEIQSATRDFRDENVIGKGEFGKVYKGHIGENGAVSVAIKRRLASNPSLGRAEFVAEIGTLSKFRHHNIISLIGYCDEQGEMILVYEYMLNGSLADHLHMLSSLSWNERLKICMGAGRGLDYLHSGRSIMHRDVKPTNIPLDENFTAKVSDFRLAKHVGNDGYVLTEVRGIIRYLDPSIVATGGTFTKAIDIYSFGIILLEVLPGKGEVGWIKGARKNIKNGQFDLIVASNLKEHILEDCLNTFIEVVKICGYPNDPEKRRSMTQVVAKLEVALDQQERTWTTLEKLQNRVIPSGDIGSTQKDGNEVEVDKCGYPNDPEKRRSMTEVDSRPDMLNVVQDLKMCDEDSNHELPPATPATVVEPTTDMEPPKRETRKPAKDKGLEMPATPLEPPTDTERPKRETRKPAKDKGATRRQAKDKGRCVVL